MGYDKMKLNDTEYSLCTNHTEEQLTEWLERSEETGHYRGYARHHLGMALLEKRRCNERMNDTPKEYRVFK